MDYEIQYGGARASIAGTGATLRAFEVDGVPYLETFAAGARAPLGSGAVLLPWPNRTAGAQWDFHGEKQRLEVTEPARGNASHGLVRHAAWAPVEVAEATVALAVEIIDEPGWPFRFRATITYALDHRGLVVTHGVENLGERTMPFGVGAHPYPRPGRADLETCELTLAATSHLPLDPDKMTPAGPAAPAKLHRKPLRDLVLDDAFGDCAPGQDGLVRHTLAGPDGGVEVWADPVFRWVQVFTPAEFPGRPGRAVAIEPMTCPPDALNSGTDLLRVAPGGSWSASWGITPLGLAL
ncbi:aldose 1-epimerase [Alloactinosynnema sp. L-07]|uniref:aldose 1-epimerase family protein n=1 Tax=Alloactinosynnema sp. L-07 TaxID=1653480 RepID=UPI00065EF836|nr:aldose 1-epimerase family protein [Alloactinosynnema sp. L-07]CRK61340.1 aldose 1-epimerase [Alloactinosynnema sp. L-07]